MIYKSMVICVMLLCVAGCKQYRPISNSGYPAGRSHVATPDAFLYRGELSEADVLGLNAERTVSRADIERALLTAHGPQLRYGQNILLVQSGAAFPDAAMMTNLTRHFRVTPYSGLPPQAAHCARCPATSASRNYAQQLQYTAARAGAETIICYWGVLESARENMPSKPISWVPVANWLLPDETQHTQIKLKMALIDTRTGSWTMFSPAPFNSRRISTRAFRKTVDQRQVETLKQQVYAAAADELLQQCSGNFPNFRSP